jgi:hypothetical protein
MLADPLQQELPLLGGWFVSEVVAQPRAREETVPGLAHSPPPERARFTRPEQAPTSFLGLLRAAFFPKIGDPAKLTR